MFNVMENRRWYLLASGILIALSIVALVVSAILSGLPLTIDPATADPQATLAAGLTALVTVIAVPGLIWWLFRAASNAIQYGIGAILALAHNVLIPCGFYALMGMLVGWPADPLFFVAILAIVGLSIQDFTSLISRVRENASAHRWEPHSTTINRAVLDHLNPTLAARLGAVLILVALLLVGGPVLLPLAATLLVGVIGETYSNVSVAALLLTL
jgi:preprotein translocase subunit SecF